MRTSPRLVRRTLSAFFQVTLVVFGVLIALGANEWNNGRRDRIQERHLLTALAEDLRRDSTMLAADIETARERAGHAAMIAAMLATSHDGDAAPAEVLLALDGLGRYVPTPFSDRTYRDLMAGGGIALIRDTRLRADLHEYHAAIGRQDPLNELYRARLWYGYQPLVVGAFPLSLQRQILLREPLSVAPDDLDQVVQYFRNTDGGLLQVHMAYRTYSLIEIQYSRLLAQAAELIADMDSALRPDGGPR